MLRIWNALPEGVKKFLFLIGLALTHPYNSMRLFVRLINPPVDDDELLMRSKAILRNGRRSYEAQRAALRDRGLHADRAVLSREQLASFVGVAVAYLGIATYVFGYMYFSTMFNRLLPGMAIPYPYLGVLEATYTRTALLILAGVPALTIAARYISPDFLGRRQALREASRYAFLASAAGHEIRRRPRRRRRPDLVATREDLRNLRNDILKEMPDGWWVLATALQVLRFRLIWVEFFVIPLLAGTVWVMIWSAHALQTWLYTQHWAVVGTWYVVTYTGFELLLVFLASIVASTLHTLLLALEAHYHTMPGKLLRRRIAIGLLTLAVLFFAVEELGRSQGKIQELTYEYRFPRVAVHLKEGVESAGGQLLIATSVQQSVVDSRTVVGYLVPVPTSEDFFLLIPLQDSSSPTSPVRLARIRIAADDVGFVTRNTGPYDEPNRSVKPPSD